MVSVYSYARQKVYKLRQAQQRHTKPAGKKQRKWQGIVRSNASDKIKRGHNVLPHLLVSLLKLNAVAKPKQLALSHQGSEFVLSIFDRSEQKKKNERIL